jgi:hypothetical protein
MLWANTGFERTLGNSKTAVVAITVAIVNIFFVLSIVLLS